MNLHSDKRTHRINAALNVAPLIRPTLDQLGVATVDDLLSLNLDSVRSIKGVGVAKIDAIAAAIDQARIYAGEASGDPSEDANPESTENLELVFVPSLLRNAFKQHEITGTRDLFRLVRRELEKQSGWGDKKIQVVAELQRLYRLLVSSTPETLVADVVPEALLPEISIGKLTIQGVTVRSRGVRD